MPSWRRASLRARITVAAATVVTAALVLAAVGLVWSVRSLQTSRLQDAAQEQVDFVARGVAAGGGLPHSGGVAATEGFSFLLLVLDDSGATVESRSLGFGPPPGRLSDRLGRFRGRGVLTLEARRYAVASADVVSPDGLRTVVALSPLAEVVRSADAIVNTLWFGIPALALGVAVLTWLVVGRSLKPIEAMRAEVTRIKDSTLDRRLPRPESDDEVDRLAHTLNEMLDRLEAAAIRQREFVSDASHELRSPVASIRTQLEVALRNASGADWTTVAEGVLADNARLERLVDDLLTLARLDETAPAPIRQDVDLDDLLLEETGRDRGVPVDVSRVAPQKVSGDPAQLRRVVSNLLDNAARHADSKIAVELERRDGAVVMVVEDDGPGIPEGDRERVFERFVRLDQGRARAGGGVGLGLALAVGVVRSHGGAIEVGESRLGGARFVVTLPATD